MGNKVRDALIAKQTAAKAVPLPVVSDSMFVGEPMAVICGCGVEYRSRAVAVVERGCIVTQAPCPVCRRRDNVVSAEV